MFQLENTQILKCSNSKNSDFPKRGDLKFINKMFKIKNIKRKKKSFLFDFGDKKTLEKMSKQVDLNPKPRHLSHTHLTI